MSLMHLKVILRYFSLEDVPLPLGHPDGKAIFHSSFQPGGPIAVLRPIPHDEKRLYPCKKENP